MIQLRNDNTFFYVLHKTTSRQLRKVAIIFSPLTQYSRIRHYPSRGTTVS